MNIYPTLPVTLLSAFLGWSPHRLILLSDLNTPFPIHPFGSIREIVFFSVSEFTNKPLYILEMITNSFHTLQVSFQVFDYIVSTCLTQPAHQLGPRETVLSHSLAALQDSSEQLLTPVHAL